MENMRITKDSAGGALKVMIEEGLESPPRRYSYSPAPVGHFPEELATTAPSGMLSWDDVRVRYDYYKSRGYLRDLDLKVGVSSSTLEACCCSNSKCNLFISSRIILNGKNGGTNIKNGLNRSDTMNTGNANNWQGADVKSYLLLKDSIKSSSTPFSSFSVIISFFDSVLFSEYS